MENNPFLDVDINFSTSVDEIRWEQFITEIINGNVIPVIGSGLLMANEQNIHEQLLDLFVRKCGITTKVSSFSQLVYDNRFPQPIGLKRGDYIYEMINNALQQVKLPPSKLLFQLLNTKKFPFVITTSFTPIVENVMREIYGDVRVLQFRNNPTEDMKIGIGDVANAKELEQPTVFYMFGKHSIEPHSYVVTDWDMISFCRSWLTGHGTPKTLHNLIKSHHLLMLGNNYSDWLFRFIISAMYYTKEDMSSSLLVDPYSDDLLLDFLKRLEFFIQRDPQAAVGEIIRRIEQRSSKPANTQFQTDVFLSYSRSDTAIVNKIYQALTKQGLSVWMDEGGIPDFASWKPEMLAAVSAARVFVPILSLNIEKEYSTPHEYRTEWDEAVSISKKLGGRDFILPVAEVGFDFYNKFTKVPEEFKEKNAVKFTRDSDFQQIAQSIYAKVQEVKQLTI